MKDVQKSIRMTQQVYSIVSGYRGNGFNEQFELLVLDFMRGREQMVHEAELLQAHIADKRAEMRRVQQRLEKMRDVDRRVAPLIDALTALLDSGGV